LLAILVGFAFPAYSRTDDCVLLLQQTPVQGGIVTPEIGIAHTFKYNKTITLTAVPKPGYHFVYWLGDVSEPTSNNTAVTLNAPKLIIAVFTRNRFEFLESPEVITPSGGGGRLLWRPSEGGTGLPHQGTRRQPDLPGPFIFPPSSLTIEESPLTEGEEGTIIIEEEPFTNEGTITIKEEPIPEPCTLTLFMGAGLLILYKRRKPPV